MSGAYAQIRLTEVIDALIDRRLELLAELSSIEQQFRDAGVKLTEIPTLNAARQAQAGATATLVSGSVEFVGVPAPKKRRFSTAEQERRRLREKPCELCQQTFLGTETRRFCHGCFRRQASERMGAMKRRPVEAITAAQDAADGRLAADVDRAIAVGQTE